MNDDCWKSSVYLVSASASVSIALQKDMEYILPGTCISTVLQEYTVDYVTVSVGVILYDTRAFISVALYSRNYCLVLPMHIIYINNLDGYTSSALLCTLQVV